MARRVLAFFALSHFAVGINPTEQHGMVAPSNAAVHTFALRKSNSTSQSISAAHSSSTSNTTQQLRGGAPMPCQCQASNPAWVAPTRTAPKCIFIDLGAADGNTFNSFINNGYGPVANCPSGDWEAVLVEANPHFNAPLQQIAARFPGKVTSMSATAAYMCEGSTSFYLDTTNHDQNYWGSSMSTNHPDTIKSGKQKVTVPTMNLNKIIAEKTIPGDWVMVKMDIEGSEFDVLPCLAQSPSAHLVDRLYLEQHDPSWGLSGTTAEQMEQVKTSLRNTGVDIPPYFSHTL